MINKYPIFSHLMLFYLLELFVLLNHLFLNWVYQNTFPCMRTNLALPSYP
jgi:hypothetical protein